MTAGHGYKFATARATSPGGTAEPMGYYSPAPNSCTHVGWTAERVERLKALWSEGLSASQIAKKLGGITRNAVIGKVHRLGLSGRATPSSPRRTLFRAPAPRKPSLPREIAPGAPTKLHPAGNRVYVVSEDRPLPVARTEGPGTATILTLGKHMCRWPIGDPRDVGFTLCGRPKAEAGPYCEAHTARAVKPMPGGKKPSASELARSLRRWAA